MKASKRPHNYQPNVPNEPCTCGSTSGTTKCGCARSSCERCVCKAHKGRPRRRFREVKRG